MFKRRMHADDDGFRKRVSRFRAYLLGATWSTTCLSRDSIANEREERRATRAREKFPRMRETLWRICMKSFFFRLRS